MRRLRPPTGRRVEGTLIGSAAVAHWDATILRREPKDRDYLALEQPQGEGADWIDGSGILESYPMGPVATLDEVYTLKVSHSFWVITPNSWHKHLRDIQLLRQAGATLVPELYRLAYRQWELRKGPKVVNLNQDREEFFSPGVRREYDHDSLHASVAFHSRPLYERILAANAEVLTSRAKFEQLSHQERKELVEEEVSVLALERELIPQGRTDFEKIDLFVAYGRQLRALITQYSKGYFPLWIVENYFEVFRPTRDYWTIFQASPHKVLLPPPA